MGQQLSAQGDGTSATSSSHHLVSTSPHNTSVEARTRPNSADTSPSSAWRNKGSAASSSAPSRSESEMGEDSSLKPKNDTEVSRMSIRAAIDTFIENCLSSHSDYSPPMDDTMADDSQVNSCSSSEDAAGDNKHGYESSKSRNLKSSKNGTDDDNLNVVDSENANHFQTIHMGDQHSCNEVEKESKGQVEEPKDGTISCSTHNSQLIQEKDADNESTTKLITEQFTATSSSPSAKQLKTATGTEKQSFSAYLQERLKTVDLDKRDELTQLALSKDIQSHGQMLMWEMMKKPPVDLSDTASQSNAPSSSAFMSGPVKLQTVIDRVLDNSLRNQDQHPAINCSKRNGDDVAQEQVQDTSSYLLTLSEVTQDKASSLQTLSEVTQDKASSLLTLSEVTQDKASSLQSLSEVAAIEQLESQEKNVCAPASKTRLSFKDHIEKVLLETFLSFEEEERREALKAESENNWPTIETDTDKLTSGSSRSLNETDKLNSSNDGSNNPFVQTDKLNSNKGGSNRPTVERDKLNTNKDGAISVQDIVDQVISQTEMISKLLIPSTADMSKQAYSSGQCSDSSVPSGVISTQSNPRLKYHTSSQNRALLEAQRHAIHKEHQSSNNVGRKRGRPRLSSPVNNSSKRSPEPAKDIKAGYQDVRSGQIPSRVSDHPHASILPQDYTPTNHLHFGNPGGVSSLGTSKGIMSPAAVMIQQSHHVMHKSPSPSTVRKCLTGSVSSGYRFNPHDTFHQQHGSHTGPHLPSHTQPQQDQSRPLGHHGQMSSSNVPSAITLADQVKGNLLSSSSPLAHIHGRSCSCNNCITHFSQGKSHTTRVQQQMPHSFSKLDSAGDYGQHHPLYHPYPAATSSADSGDLYSRSVSVNSQATNPEAAVPRQGLPLQTIISASQSALRQWKDMGPDPSSRDAVSDFSTRTYSPGHYQPYQGHVSQTYVVKSILLDPRCADTENGAKVEHLVYEEDSLQRVTREKVMHSETTEGSKVEGASSGASISQETDQPLDLSAKPCPSNGQGTRISVNSDLPGENIDLSDRSSSYRSSSSLPPRGQGQYVESLQQGPNGHHLQRLENSVDRFLSHRHPQSQLHMSFYSFSPQQQQQRQKFPLLPAAHQTHPDGQGGPLPSHSPHSPSDHYSERVSQDQVSSGHRTGLLHPRQSPVSYTRHPSPSLQQLPLMSQPQPQDMTESSASGQYENRSPGLILRQNFPKSMDSAQHLQPDHSKGNHTHSARDISPSVYQILLAHDPENENKGAPTIDAPRLSPSICPQSSPSPEDNQKLNVCKHESLQNIIGNHAASDILYLICRLCRQTYGSPYGFRKHFRNQHGFEPKADHTIVQTISATKTARAHPGPLDPIIVHTRPSDPTMVHPGPLDPTIVHPRPSDPTIVHPRPSDPTIVHPRPSDPTMVHPRPSDPTMIHSRPSDTTMVHTRPSDATEKPLQSIKDEKLQLDDQHLHGQSIKSPLAGSRAPPSSQPSLVSWDDNKSDVIKELSASTKCLECPECGQTFQLNDFGSYKRHCRQHSLHRVSGPFACHECERSFSEPGHLQEHLATHSSFTPSVCGICRTFFSSPNYLAGHLQAAHGVVNINEAGQRHAESSDGNKLSDSIKMSEHSSEQAVLSNTSKLKRSASFSDWPVMASPSSLSQNATPVKSGYSGIPSSSGHSGIPSAEQQVLIRPASISSLSSHKLPASKRQRFNVSPGDSLMFTVHTPKGLEVQKLPADAIVITASPDSSYDEARFPLDSQTGGVTMQKEAPSDKHDGNCQSESGSHGQDTRSSSAVPGNNVNTSHNRCDNNKDERESNSSDRCTSVESASLSLNGSLAPSSGLNDADTYYKHKKYSRHRKRDTISDLDSEPVTKSKKVDESNVADKKDLVVFAVSSSMNSDVTVQDCESSCSRCEDPGFSWSKGVEGKTGQDQLSHKCIDSLKREQEEKSPESKGNKSDLSNDSSKSLENFKKPSSGDGGTTFKWDRQTRSQAGKPSQSVNCTS